MKTTNTTRLAALALGIAAIAGCSSSQSSKNDSAAGSIASTDTTLRTDTSMRSDTGMRSDTAAMSSKYDSTKATVTVADVKVGKSVDTQKKIVNETDDFMPMDTVYIVVHTTGMGSAKLNVRVNAADGKVVTEHSETISPTANDAYTDFHLSKKNGLKVGKYTTHVTLNGSDMQTKDFTVKKSS